MSGNYFSIKLHFMCDIIKSYNPVGLPFKMHLWYVQRMTKIINLLNNELKIYILIYKIINLKKKNIFEKVPFLFKFWFSFYSIIKLFWWV